MNFQGSPGFMYYSLDETPKKKSTDFIPFGDDCNVSHDGASFSPSCFSSPQDHNRKSPRAYNNNGNRRGRPYGNFNKNSRMSGNFRRSGNNGSGNFMNRTQDNNYAKYMHPSFTEDPWRHLEKAKGNESMERQDNEQLSSETT